jgi:hypothetical protein
MMPFTTEYHPFACFDIPSPVIVTRNAHYLLRAKHIPPTERVIKRVDPIARSIGSPRFVVVMTSSMIFPFARCSFHGDEPRSGGSTNM